jgi:hypothetical protein
MNLLQEDLKIHLSFDSFLKEEGSNFDKYQTHTLEIPFPNYFQRNRDEYSKAFLTCITISLEEEINFSLLTEEDIFYIAVVAYIYGDLTLLQGLRKYITTLSDDYFWIFLAEERYFFYSIMEVEIYRRRVSLDLSLIILTNYSFEYKSPRKESLLSLNFNKEEISRKENLSLNSGEEKSLLSESSLNNNNVNSRLFPLDRYQLSLNDYFLSGMVEGYYLNLVTKNYLANVIHYGVWFRYLLDEITKAGGIIAGGFVNSLVNPTYFLFKLELPNPNFSESNYIESQIQSYLNKENKDSKIPKDLYDCARAYYAKCRNGVKLDFYVKAILDADAKSYKHYNVAEGLRKYSRYLRVIDGTLYLLEFQQSTDLDIFVTEDDFSNKIKRIYKTLHSNGYIRVKTMEHKIHVTNVIFNNLDIKLQIIKRKYSDVKEILAGFDLNSSRVALLDNEQILATRSYIDAVEFGINIISPSCQSTTFNNRIVKYSNRGFTPYLVGDILTKFKLLDINDFDVNNSYSISELLLYRKTGYLSHLLQSEYEEDEKDNNITMDENGTIEKGELGLYITECVFEKTKERRDFFYSSYVHWEDESYEELLKEIDVTDKSYICKLKEERSIIVTDFETEVCNCSHFDECVHLDECDHFGELFYYDYLNSLVAAEDIEKYIEEHSQHDYLLDIINEDIYWYCGQNSKSRNARYYTYAEGNIENNLIVRNTGLITKDEKMPIDNVRNRCNNIISGLIKPGTEDILYILSEALERMYSKIEENTEISKYLKKTKKDGGKQVVYREIFECLNKLGFVLFWNGVNPNKILNGSFNPSLVDYLGNRKREAEIIPKKHFISEELENVLRLYFYDVVILNIIDYYGLYESIYSLLYKFSPYSVVGIRKEIKELKVEFEEILSIF